MKRPPTYKIINRRRYRLFDHYKSKKEAQEWARGARKQRKSARVVKYGLGWSVYVYRERRY